MAELEITYIPYGLDEISQLDLMTNLANGLPDFVKSYKWLLKPGITEKFLNAYKDIINHGITGASNSSGIWEITHGLGKIDVDNMSPIDKLIYEHAAYYIQLLMALMTPRKKAEEDVKKDLKDFNFVNDFNTSILNEYGGLQALFRDPEYGWNTLDPRGANGLRGIDKRRDKVRDILQNYLNNYKDGQYNFEGTSFKDDADVRSKILKAINALDTIDDTTDDVEAFNALGLPYRKYFSNGGNESTDKINPQTGTPYTYNEWNKYQQELKELKAKLESEKLKQQKANLYSNFKFYLFNLAGTPLTNETSLNIINKLNNGQDLDGNDISGLNWAFKQAIKNGGLLNLSREELSKFGPRYSGTPNRLKKLPGLEGIYYDSIGNRIIRPYKLNQQVGTTLLTLIDLNNPLKIQELKKAELVKQMNNPILGNLDLTDLSNFGFDEATGNELWAVLNDIGAFVNPEAVTGTAMALNAARLRDKNREGWSWDRVLDWGTSALGGLPVIGDAASVIKAGSNLVKLANRSARVGSFIAMAFSAVNMPEAWDSIKKIYNKGITSMTPQDILNITYGLMGLFAGIKTINSVNARSKPQTKTEHSIEIDGKKVVLPDEVIAKKVSNEYKSAKNNKEASDKVIKILEVRDAAKKAGIEINDASKITSGSGFLRGNQFSRKFNLAKSPVKQNNVNTGEMTGGSSNSFYMPKWRQSFLSNNIEIKNPLRKSFDWALGRTPEVKSTKAETNTSKNTEKPSEKPSTETSESKKTTKKTYTKEEISKMKQNISDKYELKSSRDLSKVELKSGEINIGTNENPIHIKVGIKEAKKASTSLKKAKEIRERNAKKIKELLSKMSDKQLKESRKKLLEAKRLGWIKQGGTINPSLDEIIEDFIKNNNI